MEGRGAGTGTQAWGRLSRSQVSLAESEADLAPTRGVEAKSISPRLPVSPLWPTALPPTLPLEVLRTGSLLPLQTACYPFWPPCSHLKGAGLEGHEKAVPRE